MIIILGISYILNGMSAPFVTYLSASTLSQAIVAGLLSRWLRKCKQNDGNMIIL